MMKNNRAYSWFINHTEKCFGLDVRAIALFRVCYASLILTDLLSRFRYLSAHYTDSGVLPRSAVDGGFFEAGSWSIHLFGGSYLFQALVFAFSGLVAVLLLLGYRTRLCSILAWLLLLSLQNRNPLILHGGDTIFIVLAFWAMFLPLGATYSLDRLFATSPPKLPKRIFSAATIAITLQICMIYWFAAILKTDPIWRIDGTAVYYTLNVEAFSKPIAQYFLAYPGLMKFLSFSTLYFEGFGPFLLFAPFFFSQLRTLTVIGFIALHVGFALCIELGLFPFFAIAAWLLLIPSWVFDRLGVGIESQKTKQWLKAKFGRLFEQKSRKSTSLSHNKNFQLPIWASVFATFCIFYTLLCNIRSMNEDYERFYPQHFDNFGLITGLGQEWGLFAPKPMMDDGWFVIPAKFANGEKLDIHSNNPISWSKPKDVANTYGSMRWSKYLIELWLPDQEDNLSLYSQFLCNRWNAQLDNSNRLVSFDIFFMLEPTLLNSKESPIERLHLWHQYCGFERVAHVVEAEE